MKKKVLHLRSSGGLLGAENVILELTKHSEEYGYSPIVGALHDEGDPIPEFLEYAETQGIETQLFTAKSKIDHSCIKNIRSYCKKEHIDLLHTHGYREDIFGLLAMPRMKKVATNHLWKNTNRSLRMYAWIDSLALRFYNQIIAVSDSVLNDMKGKGLPLKKMHMLSNGIDLSRFTATSSEQVKRQLKEELNVPQDKTLITMISSLTTEKGHTTALEAMKQLSKTHDNFHLLIVGDGPERQSLESLSESFELDSFVTFAGKRYDVPNILEISDIFLLASYIEGLPMAMLEAMASGKAIVATHVGDVAMALEEQSGKVIKPNDSDGIVQALSEFLESDNIRNTYGHRARMRVENHFSSKTMTEKYCEIYNTVTS